MFEAKNSFTKILIINEDESSFHLQQCVALALGKGSSIDMIYAKDASEALHLIEREAPDVILFNGEETEEADLLYESLSYDHPPVVFQTDEDLKLPKSDNNSVRCIPQDETIEGIHETLQLLMNISDKFSSSPSTLLH